MDLCNQMEQCFLNTQGLVVALEALVRRIWGLHGLSHSPGCIWFSQQPAMQLDMNSYGRISVISFGDHHGIRFRRGAQTRAPRTARLCRRIRRWRRPLRQVRAFHPAPAGAFSRPGAARDRRTHHRALEHALQRPSHHADLRCRCAQRGHYLSRGREVRTAQYTSHRSYRSSQVDEQVHTHARRVQGPVDSPPSFQEFRHGRVQLRGGAFGCPQA